ncbi:unnamed protein product [[Candida] boidinii]|nr:unnamed protein product [[Candida] boidinii]
MYDGTEPGRRDSLGGACMEGKSTRHGVSTLGLHEVSGSVSLLFRDRRPVGTADPQITGSIPCPEFPAAQHSRRPGDSIPNTIKIKHLFYFKPLRISVEFKIHFLTFQRVKNKFPNFF